MHWIDGHLDLAYVALHGRDLTQPCADRRTACVSLPDLQAGDVRIAFATIFTEPNTDSSDDPAAYPPDDLDAAEAAGHAQLAVYQHLAQHEQLRIIRSRSDLDGTPTAKIPSIVLLMEGADPIRSPADVGWWHEQGLRLVGLTWGMGTRYAGGNAVHGPLTPAGRDMVAALDSHGIIHDASHLADDALDDLVDCTDRRIVATHSNCRSLMDQENQRHLRDDHIAEIGRRDGIIGLNLYGAFLARNRRATIADCVRHVDHVCAIMDRRDGVALGSDMDGGFGPGDLPTDLDHPTKLTALAEALRDAGWNDDEIHGFAHRNWMRLLEQTLD